MEALSASLFAALCYHERRQTGLNDERFMTAAPPDILILGAAKCGTSSLHAWLAEHPDICMSEPKEPKFFEAEFEQGFDFYRRRYFPHLQELLQ